jgi:hypothetical protein
MVFFYDVPCIGGSDAWRTIGVSAKERFRSHKKTPGWILRAFQRWFTCKVYIYFVCPLLSCFDLAIWTPNMDRKYGPPIWTLNMDPQYGPPIWTPNMAPNMDLHYNGPPIWTENMDLQYGPPIWTPNIDPKGLIIWTLLSQQLVVATTTKPNIGRLAPA